MRDYLSKLTVKDLEGILRQMGAKGFYGLRKAGLIDVIMVQIEIDHSEALRMDEEMISYTVPGTDVTLTGIPALVMIRHEKNVRRYNPTMARDRDGKVILTAKQRRRIQKKDRKYGKQVGLYAA